MKPIINTMINGFDKSVTKNPKSLMRLIKFFRLFGFAFIEINNEEKKSVFYYLKNILMVSYNVYIIISFILTQVLSNSTSYMKYFSMSPKPVMNVIFYISMSLFCMDLTFGYIFSLIRGKKLISLLKTEDICEVDCNTKFANKAIALILIILLFIPLNFYIGSKVFIGYLVEKKMNIIFPLILTFVYLSVYTGGMFMMQIIYVYIISVISSQLNNLKHNIIKGNNKQISN